MAERLSRVPRISIWQSRRAWLCVMDFPSGAEGPAVMRRNVRSCACTVLATVSIIMPASAMPETSLIMVASRLLLI
jgi:hypothetical protein